MSLVESIISNQTLVTTYQAYVEANFVNDMHNMAAEVIETSVKTSLTDIANEVILEVFIAKEANCIISQVVQKEATDIVQK